jgi:CRP/FNR family cyclic AMP-dependent transcriptional regulator
MGAHEGALGGALGRAHGGAHGLARLLAANPFFAGMGEDAITAIAGLCRTRSLARNAVLFQKGDPGDALYALRRGQVRIATGTAEGRSVTLNLLGPGDVFGEIALLDGHPRTAEAVAIEATELFVIERGDFLGLLTRDPAVAIRIIGFLCGRLRWMSERMEEATLLPLDTRLARRLIMLSEDYGAEIQVTQTELAAFVGAARESVNRVLQDWRRAGIIDLGRSRVTVKSARPLAALGARSRV